MNTLSLVAFLCLCVAVFGQSGNQFQADITIYNDPNIRGALTGHLYYNQPGKVQRINYGIGPTEIIDFDRRIKYLYCSGTCDGQTWNEPQPIYYRESSDTTAGSASVPGRGTCTGYRKTSPPNTGVQTIYIDGSNLPCRAVFVSGKTVDFGAVTALPNPLGNVFTEYTSWNCPAQQCNKMIDFMLVFDDSGSIDAPSFRQEKDFGGAIARAYTFGPQNTAMGLVMFSTTSRLAIAMTVSQQSFLNQVAAVTQTAGNTCIGCGIAQAHQHFISSGRANVAKVMIVLTDGQNNQQTSSFTTVVNNAKAYGIIIFAIGVAGYDINQIRFISSDIPGVQTDFTTPNFAQLSGILDSLIVATCIDIPGNPCGAGCLGFCSCGATCVCPNVCNDNNECTTDQCIQGQGGNGCTFSPRPCSDGDLCTTDGCNPSTGCTFTPITCNDNNPCTDDFCIRSAGCQSISKICADNDSCTTDGCSPASGCTFTRLPPSQCSICSTVVCAPVPCSIVRCNTTTGNCDATPINCDDRNLCSVDTCNPATGTCEYTPVNCDDSDACTHDGCDPLSGCTHIPFNVTVDCNDNNVCTNDTCDSTIGCIHPNVTCADDDPCTDNICNSILGCLYPVTDCTSLLANTVDEKKRGCYAALCTRVRNGCYVDQIPGTSIDECQVCNGDGKSCVLGLSTDAVVGISAGLLAVIIIAAVIVCAALGIFGGKKGYDIWLNHKNNMQSASINPLYNDSGLAGNNPLYSEKTA